MNTWKKRQMTEKNKDLKQAKESEKEHTENIYSSTMDIYHHVIEDYHKYDTELNSMFFDFQISLPKSDIIKIYADIQHDINGDNIVCIDDATIEILDDEPVITGIELNLENILNDEIYDEIYTGNMEEFLKSFNDNESKTKLYRIMDKEYLNNDRIKGIKLDFVW